MRTTLRSVVHDVCLTATWLSHRHQSARPPTAGQNLATLHHTLSTLLSLAGGLFAVGLLIAVLANKRLFVSLEQTAVHDNRLAFARKELWHLRQLADLTRLRIALLTRYQYTAATNTPPPTMLPKSAGIMLFHM